MRWGVTDLMQNNVTEQFSQYRAARKSESFSINVRINSMHFNLHSARVTKSILLKKNVDGNKNQCE